MAKNTAKSILKYFKEDTDITPEIFGTSDIRNTYKIVYFEYEGRTYEMSFYNQYAYSNNKDPNYLGKITLYGDIKSVSIEITRGTPYGIYDIKEWIDDVK